MRKILLVIDDYKELVALENLLRRLGFDVLSVGKDILVNDALARFMPEIVIATLKGRAVDGMKVSIRVRRQTPAPLVAFLTSADNAANITQEQKLYMDGVLLSPLQPQTVIRIISQMASLDPGPLIGKFQKMTSNRLPDPKSPVEADDSKHGEPAREGVVVKGPGAEAEAAHFVRGGNEPALSDDPWEHDVIAGAREETDTWDPVKNAGQASTLRTERSARYEQFLSAHDEPADAVLPKEKFALAARELKRADAAQSASQGKEQREEQTRSDEEKREFVRKLFTAEQEKKK